MLVERRARAWSLGTARASHTACVCNPTPSAGTRPSTGKPVPSEARSKEPNMSQSETIGGERPAGTDAGGLGARFARLFSPKTQPEEGLGETVEFTPEGVETQNGDEWAPRFASTWRGYDRVAVDEYLCTLEDELATVRAERIPEHAIQDEIDRFGNDTAEILRVARAKADAISSR